MNLAPYADVYRENLHEATVELQAARRRYDALVQIGTIFRDEDGVTRCKGDEAARVYGDFVRWRSDWHHWEERLRQAHRDAGVVTAPATPSGPRPAPPEQQDMRLPPEPTDEQLAEAAARKAEIADQLAARAAAAQEAPPEIPESAPAAAPTEPVPPPAGDDEVPF